MQWKPVFTHTVSAYWQTVVQYKITFSIPPSLKHPLWNEDWKQNWCSDTRKVVTSVFQPWDSLLSNLVQIPLSACCESEFKFHYHLSSLFPALKSHSKWIELGCNSFFLFLQVNQFRQLYSKVINDKHDDVMAKFGAILAQGILDAGKCF